MLKTHEPLPVPLKEDPTGILLIEGTRVPLELVAHEFYRGASAEEIVDTYPTLTLVNVYLVIAFILRHEKEMAEYLHERAAAISSMKDEIESELPPFGIRARLLSREKSRVELV